MAMTQMNVRIDSVAKAQGDAVLARFGYTPSGFVRDVWRKIASTGTVKDLTLDDLGSPDSEEGADSWDSDLVPGYAIYLARVQGIEFRDEPCGDIDWRELREEAYLERALERGML